MRNRQALCCAICRSSVAATPRAQQRLGHQGGSLAASLGLERQAPRGWQGRMGRIDQVYKEGYQFLSQTVSVDGDTRVDLRSGATVGRTARLFRRVDHDDV